VAEIQLTSDEFVVKVWELTQSNQLTGTSSDLKNGRVQLQAGSEVFFSPDMRVMPDYVYEVFRKQLETLMPACDREKGFYW